ncbi:MAG: cytochrome c oxidase assembly protein, partial [Proteobacteria bacterium]|nr:cytochrome c oxidase assembly protein [Pseudomonadota bacterium]
HPVISLVLFNLNFWFWHQARWYNLALYHDLYHMLEHALMAITSLYLWRHILDPKPLHSPLPMGLRILFLASFMALNIVLAALLTYASEPWYAYDNIPMPSWWGDHWTRLDDQRLGGLIMWVPGGIITFLFMTLCFFVWVQREGEHLA